MNEGDKLSVPVASAPSRRVSQGPVMPIGGAEATEPGGEILERFVDLAGGKKARIAIIPTASDDPQRSGEGYATLFRELGAKKADWLRVEQRPEANSEEALSLLREAGVVVAGSSAGASILSTLMMAGGTGVGGNSNDSAARKGMVDIVAGFGLLQDIIIDQHFSQRGRLGRLLSVFAGTPGLLGVGLDEDTAVLIDREGTLEVLGSNMVTIVDGRNTISDYFDRQDGEVLTITGSSLHVLAGGRFFDVDTREAIGMDTQ
ncbi:MAG: cyanophycinase [Thermomicrobiales bacterium]|nr:cyanophycinase [Thermomicrobiales bacterium]